jgi:hypothetical protein
MPLVAISHLTAGRSQIGTSLSFHLFFAVLFAVVAVSGTIISFELNELVTGLLLIVLSASAAGIDWPDRGRRAALAATPAGAAAADQPGTRG